jgi:hypothetical protein
MGNGYRYKDRTARRDGLVDVALKPGVDGKAKLSVLAKGPGMQLDDAFLQGIATVQVQASNGQSTQCWEAYFSSPTVNDTGRYVGRSD